MSLTLYYHPLSSFCWKVLIALYENDISFTPRLINLGDADDRAAFLKLWPIGKFPVLRDEQSQRTIPESSIIIEYLDQHFAGAMRFIPAAPDLALRTRLRDRFLDLYLHMPTQTIVFDRLRPSDTRDPLGVADARARLRTSYAMLEAELPSAGWAMGESFTLADCAALPALFYAEKVERFGDALKTVPAYLDRLKARPSVARVVAEAEPYFHMFPNEREPTLRTKLIAEPCRRSRRRIVFLGGQGNPARASGRVTMRFMVIVKATRDTEAGVLPTTEEFAAMGRFNAELVKAGLMEAGEGLHPTAKGARIAFSDGKPRVMRGPFGFTSDLTAGFWMLKAGSLDEVIEHMARAPFPSGEIEIRQVYADEDFGETFTPELRERVARLRAQAGNS